VTTIVRELKELRGVRSLECIASRAGMKRQQLHNIESGDTKNPGILTVSRIAAALGFELVLVPLDEDDQTL
jgi:DNA-binding phage protein